MAFWERKPEVTPIQKWQYLTIHIWGDPEFMGENATTVPEDWSWNYLGVDDWELVSVDTNSHGDTYGYFKRPYDPVRDYKPLPRLFDTKFGLKNEYEMRNIISNLDELKAYIDEQEKSDMDEKEKKRSFNEGQKNRTK